MMGMTSLVLLPAGVATAGGTHLAFTPVLSLVLLAVISTALGMLLLFQLIDELGPSRASLTTYLAPGFSLVLAAIILGEPITAPAVAGLVLIIVGVVISSRGRERVPAAMPRRDPRRRAARGPRGAHRDRRLASGGDARPPRPSPRRRPPPRSPPAWTCPAVASSSPARPPGSAPRPRACSPPRAPT